MGAPNSVEGGGGGSLLAGKYLVFRLEDVHYGLDITSVQEIVQMMEITKIPNAPEFVRGIINLRGKTIPAIELRSKFNLQAAEDNAKTCIIVLEAASPTGSIRAGIIVDEVAEVLELEERQLAEAPEMGMADRARFVKGLGVVDGTVTILLDVGIILGNEDLDSGNVESDAGSGRQTELSQEPGEEPGQVAGEEPGIVRQISGILQQLPKGSREYRATFSMLDKMREFFQIMQEANSQELDQIMAEFDLSEQPLVQELGKLVRRLHTQIKLAGSDVAARLGEIAEHDMVSATERLEHIVHMTEDAANTTLNLAEGMIKRSTEQESANGAILERLEKTLGAGKLRPQTKKPLLEAVDALRRQAEQEKEFQEKLTEILMAQGYQDLTGQVVQRVVTLLQQLEGELLELVKAFGTTRAEKKQDTRQAELAGPLSEKSEATVSQDQVDNLLESLGF